MIGSPATGAGPDLDTGDGHVGRGRPPQSTTIDRHGQVQAGRGRLGGAAPCGCTSRALMRVKARALQIGHAGRSALVASGGGEDFPGLAEPRPQVGPFVADVDLRQHLADAFLGRVEVAELGQRGAAGRQQGHLVAVAQVDRGSAATAARASRSGPVRDPCRPCWPSCRG